MAIRSCPVPGGGPSAPKKSEASAAVFAPVSEAASTSTISASAAPLGPPMGCIMPLSACSGSVVGAPPASVAQPSGIASRFCAAAMIFPRATVESERSTTMGSPPATGAANATGLVPKSGRVPPQGAMAAGVLANIKPTSPSAANRWQNQPVTPAWCERVTPATAIPCVRAAPGSQSMARSRAG